MLNVGRRLRRAATQRTVIFPENRTLTIPSDYGCFAIVDPDAYVGFVDKNWTLDSLKAHFLDQNHKRALVPWGCVDGNWIVRVTFGEPAPSG